MGGIKAVLFDLGDTIIVELDVPADIDTTEFEVLDGVYEVLGSLKKKFKLAIVSNTLTWGDREVTRALRRKNLTKYFDAIVTSVDAGSRKPQDAIFKKALDELEANPRETVMVGDRVDTDISGANRIGITSILCRWNDRYPLIIENDVDLPDYVIGSIKELPTLLNWLDESQ